VRRTLYFFATNAAIMAVLSIVILLLPPQYREQNGLFLLVALVFGFGGAIFSLLRSKSSAKRMPGFNRNNALVAVSTGLLNSMTREEAEAVMGHEIAHVANGDMITLTLIQGVVNVFVMFMARALASAMGRNSRMGYYLGYTVGQAVFGFLASLIVAFFSRQREYRADIGGAEFSSQQNMIGALEKLKNGKAGQLPAELAAFGISGGVSKLFSTHPPLDDRIEALKNR